jgi:hypothetical protein
MPNVPHLYKIRDKRRFLVAAMEELAGAALISFEGNLDATSLFKLNGASGDETQVLKRNTLWPKQDFVVLELEPDLVKPIIGAVGGTVPRGILHIQIEKGNCLELGLYDNFDPKASHFGSTLTPLFFGKLEAEGILTKWVERQVSTLTPHHPTHPKADQ